MGTVVDELWRYAEDSESDFFRAFRRWERPFDPNEHLKKFLFATVDEVRLWHAASFANLILEFVDTDDAVHFREGLLRREFSGDIAYPKQRDHSAHTLYNYLLGWYVYSNCSRLREELHRHFSLRGISPCWSDFASVWPFVSLLHDVGYLFEGKIDPLDTAIQSKQISIGAQVAQDYFHHRFWQECGADSVYDRERLRAMAGLREPDFSSASVAGVADALRSLGELNRLQDAVRTERDAKGLRRNNDDCLAPGEILRGDAFDLWESHYVYFGFTSMADRIRSTRRVFESLIRKGVGNTGLRLLDHGIAGGLLLLAYSTFYFRLLYGIGSTQPADSVDAAIWQRLRERGETEYGTYNAYWWWAAIVWATAAVALHNIMQQRSWLEEIGAPSALRLGEDPLAYLGILVDCVQEWDRYSISGESVITGQLPLQGVDVGLSTKNGKVLLDYGVNGVSGSVRRSLSSALQEWQQVVEIRP